MVPVWKLEPAIRALRSGEVIAYPTEAVWGLGCDPQNEAALDRLLALKHREVAKGLILVAADLAQLNGYLGSVSARQVQSLRETWPGPVTWLCPKGPRVSPLVSGAHELVALRVSAHPCVRALCTHFGGPIVSTSANRSGQEPARTASRVRQFFGPNVACIVPGACGGASRPTQIKDLSSGAILRD